jgi:hypoxanthine phosphoribosyltransferase
LPVTFPLDATFDFIGVSSYGNRPIAKEDPAGHAAWDSLGEVRLTKDMDQSLADRNVILVEDILDTGLTLNYISKLVRAHQPRIAAHCGPARQAFAPQDADPGAIYRLHHSRCLRGRLRPGLCRSYRNLPDICVLENL